MLSRTQVVVFVFIILLIIISISKDVVVGILTVGLLTNFFILFYHICRLTNGCAEDPVQTEGMGGGRIEGLGEQVEPPKPLIDKDSDDKEIDTSTSVSDTVTTNDYIPPDVSTYGQQYIDYNITRGGGIDPYKPLTNCRPDDVSFTVDNKNAMNVRRRARDKRCKTAVVKKGSDYYRYHYADELKDSENRAWWGRHEY